MKKTMIILFALIFANAVNAQCPTFSINAPSGNVVGCSPSTVPLNAVNTSTLAGVTYTWIGSVSGNTTGASINATAQTYSVYASTPSSTCTSMQTISVFQSTLTPNMTVSPISQTLTCNGACKSFTAASLSGTTNIVGYWYNPDGSPMTGPSTSPMIMCANVKGVYTAQFCSTISGCCTSQTVSVSANTVIPTMTVTSVLGGFTVNCTKLCLPMNINSSSTLAPLTYTWTNLNTSVSTLSSNGGFTVCNVGANVPGSYEAAIMDGNMCKVTQTINVTIDTLRPSPFSSTNLPSNSYTINCFTPSLVATALTNPMYSVASYSWTQPPNLIINSNTVSIGMGNIPGSSVIYTVSAMASNGCVGKSKVFFYKDVFVPPYSIVFTPSAITCANPCVAMSPFTTSTVPVTFTFTSPPPTQTATTSGALFCIPGTYTMTYKSSINGCTGITNTTVPLNITPPSTVALSDFTLCSSPTVMINGGATFTLTSYTYSWTGPGSITSPGNYNTAVNALGVYTIVIQNTTNGCTATNTANVVMCTGIENLTGVNYVVDIFPNPNNGKFNIVVNVNIENAEIRIVNSIGQEVFHQNIKQGKNEINAGVLAKGIYHYSIIQNKEPVSRGKILIE